MIKNFGLIGFPLSHSFSKIYFTEKFYFLDFDDCFYDLYPIENIESFPDLISKNNFSGLNVTIPYKQSVIPFLDSLSPTAKRIGAVNVIKFKNNKLIGYNSDYYGFKTAIVNFILNQKNIKALVLGNGGAAKAVIIALEDLNIPFKIVSRNPLENQLSYSEINENVMNEYKLIINTSPLGMYPNSESAPDLPYHLVGNQHFFYDLVYNPMSTLFMNKALEKGAKALGGLGMLQLQAEKAWEIWNEI